MVLRWGPIGDILVYLWSRDFRVTTTTTNKVSGHKHYLQAWVHHIQAALRWPQLSATAVVRRRLGETQRGNVPAVVGHTDAHTRPFNFSPYISVCIGSMRRLCTRRKRFRIESPREQQKYCSCSPDLNQVFHHSATYYVRRRRCSMVCD